MIAVPLAAEDLPYASGSTGADGALNVPGTASARYGHTAAYDSNRQRTVLFGGATSAGLSGATFEYDGTGWMYMSPNSSPSDRRDSAMAYDSNRQRVIMFGGEAGGGLEQDDTWEYDGTTWTPSGSAVRPAARRGHAMVFDSNRNRVVLFGGFNSGGAKLGDTWEYDGTTWLQRTPSSSPQTRAHHAMAYDANRRRTVLFGGDSTNRVNDTWEFDGTAGTWTQITTASQPSARDRHAMAYDSNRQRVLLFGGYNNLNDSWEYIGAAGNWAQIATPSTPPARYLHSLTYDSNRQRLILFGGFSNSSGNADTWVLNSNQWTRTTSPFYEFDMTARANGVWNFTTINIPQFVTVTFKKNLANTPVQWLASDAVTINGTIDISGSDQQSSLNVEPGNEAPGGPGGFNGGLGGRNFSISGSYLGTAGGGPGGGKPGAQNQNGENGTFSGSYGNSFLQPLIGGSGGGGGSSRAGSNGGNGGGGGGALLIASSADIVLNGNIVATGGAQGSSPASPGGAGSGGGVRLVADRITGGGTINVNSGATAGRIRLEAYYRPLAANSNSTAPSTGPPTETFTQLNNAALTVATVDGVAVRVPAGGSTANPDVIFNKSGPTTITVTGNNIPNGTPVKLRITGGTGVLELPATGAPSVLMNNNSATFTATVPPGIGTVQAFATIPLAQGAP